ncbi:Hypothetical predicted protein [Xyrichtys novacula]|uniref:Uncharacterized protein n=1 Tax=Xyrichtys novacula TaxID=13765 RepID=A0AAV1EST7_XYRNO|nr:Hypothetical predicted protein [Xyrichtys novacula]
MTCMLYSNLVGFFKSVLQEEEVFFVCAAGKQQNDCKSVSPVVEALSWLSVPSVSLFGFIVRLLSSRRVVQCCLLPPSDFSSEPHGRHSTKINNYLSVMVIALLCFTHHKWQFYINHLSDILWDGWLYLLAILSTVFVVCVCVCRAEAGGCCAGAHFLLTVIDAALVLFSKYQRQKLVCICLRL